MLIVSQDGSRVVHLGGVASLTVVDYKGCIYFDNRSDLTYGMLLASYNSADRAKEVLGEVVKAYAEPERWGSYPNVRAKVYHMPKE